MESVDGKKILFCNCRGERIDSGLLTGIDSFLKMFPAKTYKLTDLCGTLREKNEQIKNLFKNNSEYLVLGCYKRSMDLLLEQASAPENYRHVNLIETDKEEVLRSIKEFWNGSHVRDSYEEIKQDSDWPAWYPVIDYSRCTSCGQCADFCLFGVYEKTAGKVKVVNPENCKNNCPACARICPATAIVFPKYKHGGAIGGSEEIDEQAELKRQTQDMQEFLGNDVYAAIEKRKLKRQSIIRKEAMNKAMSERESALKESLNEKPTDVNI
jgi:NAD-dependent dihydropyrimidine dehydrogenase PreA subunit